MADNPNNAGHELQEDQIADDMEILWELEKFRREKGLRPKKLNALVRASVASRRGRREFNDKQLIAEMRRALPDSASLHGAAKTALASVSAGRDNKARRLRSKYLVGEYETVLRQVVAAVREQAALADSTKLMDRLAAIGGKRLFHDFALEAVKGLPKSHTDPVSAAIFHLEHCDGLKFSRPLAKVVADLTALVRDLATL